MEDFGCGAIKVVSSSSFCLLLSFKDLHRFNKSTSLKSVDETTSAQHCSCSQRWKAQILHYCTSVKFRYLKHLLEFLFYIWTFSSSRFQNRLVTLVWCILRWILDYFYLPSRHHKTDVNLSEHIMHRPSLWCVQEQLGQNPTDSTFNFNSLWILLIWRELQLALSTNVLQRETFYSDALSPCQSLNSVTVLEETNWIRTSQMMEIMWCDSRSAMIRSLGWDCFCCFSINKN